MIQGLTANSYLDLQLKDKLLLMYGASNTNRGVCIKYTISINITEPILKPQLKGYTVNLLNCVSKLKEQNQLGNTDEKHSRSDLYSLLPKCLSIQNLLHR